MGIPILINDVQIVAQIDAVTLILIMIIVLEDIVVIRSFSFACDLLEALEEVVLIVEI